MSIEFPTKLTLTSKKDSLFDNGIYPVPFEFNKEVVNVFDDMVSRSVPLYEQVIHSIVQWVYYFSQPEDKIYDLGCSTGTTLKAIADQIPFSLNLIGYDNSEAMINKAIEKCEKNSTKHSIQFECADITSQPISNAGFVLCNYTLQFVPVAKRQDFLEKVYKGLDENGVFVLSEKLRSSNPHLQEITTHIYENFKLNAGYSKTEIERKKEALDQVLIPLTLEEQMDALKRAGFKKVEPMIRWNNFCTFLAQK